MCGVYGCLWGFTCVCGGLGVFVGFTGACRLGVIVVVRVFYRCLHWIRGTRVYGYCRCLGVKVGLGIRLGVV